MNAQEQYERAVAEMREQFLSVSGQIAAELTRLTQYAAVSAPGVREQMIVAVGQIASTQQILGGATERLPSDPQERYAIMQSVLQAQQGAFHQLALIVNHLVPGWYSGLSQAAWYPSAPSPPAWPQSPAPPDGADTGGSNGTTWYPSPPTVQDLATRGWPQAHSNGYHVDTPANGRSVWPAGGAAGAVVPYGGGAYPDSSAYGLFPGRRGYAQQPPPQYDVSELRPHPGYGSNTGQALARRKRTDVVAPGAGSNKLLLAGLGVLAVIFVWLSFPWEIRRKDAIAEQKIAADVSEERSAPTLFPPAPPPRVLASPPAAPTLIARAPEVEEAAPSAPAPAPTVIVLPGGLQAGSPNVAIGNWPQQNSAPPAPREALPAETPAPAEAPPAPAARTKERVAAARPEPEPPAPAEAAPRAERYVAVLFTNQDEPTVAKTFADLQQQYPQVLGHRQGETQAVNLGKKGVWHRLVVLPAGSRQDAANLCGRLTGAGYDKCWVKLY